MKRAIVVLMLTMVCNLLYAQTIKNFVIVIADDLDLTDVEVYGGNYPTPNINQLAKEGITFTNAYITSPMCTPSRYSVLTGKYPGRCDGEGFLKGNPTNEPYVVAWNTALKNDTPTFPKLLKENGFETGLSGKWHVGEETEGGFPKFNADDKYGKPETMKKLKKYLAHSQEKIIEDGGFTYAESALWGNFDGLPLKELHFHNFGWITKGGIEFLDKVAGKKPFFLYFAPTAIHGPNDYLTIDSDQRKTLNGFDESITKYLPSKDSIKNLAAGLSVPLAHRCVGITNVDYQVGLLVKKLKEKGVYNETAIIFMADHGMEPGKAVVYNRGIKVPFIAKVPFKNRQGITEDAVISSTDLFPTILDYAGVKIPKDVQFDGKSIRKLIEGKVNKIHDFVYSESGLSRSITNGKVKYIAWRYPKSTLEKMKSGKIDYAPNNLNLKRQAHSDIAIKFYPNYFQQDQLYDLVEDPYEQVNIVNQNLDLKMKLQKRLKKITDTFANPFDYKVEEFLNSEAFKKMVEKTKDYDLNNIEWFPRDHDWMFPPVKPAL